MLSFEPARVSSNRPHVLCDEKGMHFDAATRLYVRPVFPALGNITQDYFVWSILSGPQTVLPTHAAPPPSLFR